MAFQRWRWSLEESRQATQFSIDSTRDCTRKMRVSIRSAVAIAISFSIAVCSRTVGATKLCDYGELADQLGDVVEPAFKCQQSTDYTFLPPAALPSAREVKAMCGSCQDLLVAAKKTKLPDCALALDNGSTVTIEKLFMAVVNACSGIVKNPATGDYSNHASHSKKPSPSTPTPSSRPTMGSMGSGSASQTSSSSWLAPDSIEDSESNSASESASDDDESSAGSIEQLPTIEPEVTSAVPSPSSASVGSVVAMSNVCQLVIVAAALHLVL